MANTWPAKYIENNEIKTMAGDDLLYKCKTIKFNKAISFQGYPNGDSCHYKTKYKLDHIETLIRGTLRYSGFPFIMRSLCRIGLFLKEPISKFI